MAEKAPTVSVIIATYNSTITLKTAIRSVLLQEYSDYEIWVVGDNCTDTSFEVVASFSDDRLHWVNLPQNSGSQAMPNNEGVRRANGTYIAFLGHDDLWFPGHLRLLVEALEREKADFAYCLTAMLSSDGNHFVSGQKQDFSEKAFATSQAHIPPSSWLFKKEIVSDCGEWISSHESPYMPIDVEYLKRIIEKGKKLTFVDGVFVAKFPSGLWQLYGRKNNFPQEHYIELIQTDHKSASIAILIELAHAFGKKININSPYTTQPSIRNIFKSFYHSFIFFYSYRRFPVNVFFKYRFKHNRTKAMSKRGLPTTRP